jgi:hypothetical protein
MAILPSDFDGQHIRRVYDEATEVWWFSVIDVVQVLTQQADNLTAQTLLRLVQSIPSPKAEPIKLWLAKVGYERMQEMADPGQSLDRARQTECRITHDLSVCTGPTTKPAPTVPWHNWATWGLPQRS